MKLGNLVRRYLDQDIQGADAVGYLPSWILCLWKCRGDPAKLSTESDLGMRYPRVRGKIHACGCEEMLLAAYHSACLRVALFPIMQPSSGGV
jgi:hypothetical protein